MKVFKTMIRSACVASATGGLIGHSGPAQASNVMLYGSLSQGVAHVSNIQGHSSTRMDPGTMQPDRFGMRGSEDIGDGWAANFQLESGFSVNTGSAIVASKAFNRHAWVGLSGPYGALQLGHQPDFMSDIISKYSNGVLLGNFYLFHPGNFDNLANTYQSDGALKYLSPVMHGIQLGGMYSFAEPATKQQPRGSGTKSAFLGYTDGGLRTALVYTQINDRTLMDIAGKTGVSELFGLPLQPGAPLRLDSQRIAGVGAAYQFTGLPLRLHSSYTDTQLRYRGDKTSMRSADLGAAWDYLPSSTLNIGYSQTRFAGGKWNLFSLGHVYHFSKRTELFAQTSYQRAGGGLTHAAMNSAGPSSTRNQAVLSSGIHHSF